MIIMLYDRKEGVIQLLPEWQVCQSKILNSIVTTLFINGFNVALNTCCMMLCSSSKPHS